MHILGSAHRRLQRTGSLAESRPIDGVGERVRLRRAFFSAPGLPRSVSARVRRLHRSQSWRVYLLTVPAENLYFFLPREAGPRPNSRHMQRILHCITVFIVCPPPPTSEGGGQSLYLPLYLPGGMHIHKNLTSFSVKETGNKQLFSATFKERRSVRT